MLMRPSIIFSQYILMPIYKLHLGLNYFKMISFSIQQMLHWWLNSHVLVSLLLVYFLSYTFIFKIFINYIQVIWFTKSIILKRKSEEKFLLNCLECLYDIIWAYWNNYSCHQCLWWKKGQQMYPKIILTLHKSVCTSTVSLL